MNQFFFMIGLARTSVAHSSLIIGMTPIFVLLIAAAIRQERLTARKGTGMLIAITGVLVLNTLPVRNAAPGTGPTLSGDLYVFLGGLAFALFTVFSKSISTQYSAITVNTYCYLSGALALAPITLWESRDFAFRSVSAVAWTSLLFMALFPSTICYLIYSYALTRIPASRVAAFSYVQPVLATLLAVLTVGERVTLPLVAGGAVIFSGVYLTERG
jgi:drug/metabolite transporter (DMT)-like permease